MKTQLKTLFITVILLASLFSCDKNAGIMQDDPEDDDAVETSLQGDADIDEILFLAEQDELEIKPGEGGRMEEESCPLIIRNTDNNQIVLDFGDGCLGPFGHKYKGKIIITYTISLDKNILNKTITFEDFFIRNNKSVTGSIELEIQKVNEEGFWEISTTLNELTITFPNQKTIVYNGNRKRELIGGQDDDDRTNNIYRLTGSLTIQAFSFRSFSMEITEPVIVDMNCLTSGHLARVSGTIHFIRTRGASQHEWIVDYGNGDCDNIITIITRHGARTVTIE